MKKKIVILGSTGSIGEQALQIIAFHPQRFQVVGLAAGRKIKRLTEQCRIFRPRMVATGYEELAPALQEMLEEGLSPGWGGPVPGGSYGGSRCGVDGPEAVV